MVNVKSLKDGRFEVEGVGIVWGKDLANAVKNCE